MTEEAYIMRLEELFRQSPSVQTAGFGTDSYKPGLGARLLGLKGGLLEKA